jgi:hypothetical protein
MKDGIIICLLILLLQPSVSSAHSGRTDSYGGHNKTANETYHCHSGQCLEDAKQEIYDELYPLGRKNGPERNNQSYKIKEHILNKFDSDQSEYMVPYALKAYNEGYGETYVPTFWESTGKYLLAIIIILGILGFYLLKKTNGLGLFLLTTDILICGISFHFLILPGIGDFLFNRLISFGLDKEIVDSTMIIVMLILIFACYSSVFLLIGVIQKKKEVL